MVKGKLKKSSRIVLVTAICAVSIAVVTMGYVVISKAEQSGGSPNNNPTTSRIKTIYDSLVALSHGSDAAGLWGNWGAYWNRIYSAATWVPSGNSAVTDVKSGKTFFNTTRTVATGTYPNPTGCSTQQYHASHTLATEGNNCSLGWTANSSPVTGDDNRVVFTVTSANATAAATYTNNGQTFTVITTITAGTSLNTYGTSSPTPTGTLTKASGTGDATITFTAVPHSGGYDPRTGLTWSQYLKNNAGTVEFAASGGSTWNWNGTLRFTVTAATATAGDTYTNNGQTFTVAYAIADATTLYAKPASSGLPAASGNLVRVTGAGTDPIVFSAYTLYGSNVAVGGKSATQLCSDRGNGWRLPTQIELMQAYIDGSYWNLTNSAINFWSLTEIDATNAWFMNLSVGFTNYNNKATNAYFVRCVR